MELPKVLVFSITYIGKDYILDEFLEASSKINYPKDKYRHVIIDNSVGLGYYNKLKSMGLEVYHVERGNNTREALARSQNFARKLTLEGDYDYALSLESDLLIKPDTLWKLVGDGKDVVGVLYMIGNAGNRVPCITINKKHENGLIGSRLLKKEEFPAYFDNGLLPVHNGGLGCTLIKRKVFEKISFFYYPYLKNHSDGFFANDCWRNGFRVYVDSGLFLEHHNVPWSEVKDR